jgi:hypothetical protein
MRETIGSAAEFLIGPVPFPAHNGSFSGKKPKRLCERFGQDHFLFGFFL